MTNTEISWAKAQSWWNDFTNIYARSMWAVSVSFEYYVHEHSLEALALDLINDENLSETDNIILARITNMCLDYVGTPDLQEYSAPASKTRLFEYRRDKQLVAKLECDHMLLVKEQEAVFAQLSSKGVVWDQVINKGGDHFEFYLTTSTLVEL